ncbi:3-deoxy-manno-octulosonate cytidylyltransferase [Sphaerothrix gracilis]|uniref:3-deoxy-manno-octulosonate cytidylyltransferase n=1 Tax=Sphaerothrix gracilis TaxID=3151835 RepID=UPI0031FC82F5
MKILAVIPSRYASQRFPGKPLTLLGDRPMVQWVYEAAQACAVFDRVVVATDDDRIAHRVRQFGGAVEMTRSDHQTGTDRVAEVATRYPDYEVVVNVQGDQPFVNSKMLTQLVQPYLDGQRPHMTTLACPLDYETAYSDSNSVKVICNQQQHALYFSRSPIPYFRNPGPAPVYHHLGLYAFRRDFLAQYADLVPTPLEACEGLEQLRVLEHGYTIAVSQTETAVPEINTPDDLIYAQSFITQKVAS